MLLRPVTPAIALVIMQAVPAFAAPQDDALAAIAKCAGIAEDHARLACYDAAAPQVKAAMEAPPPPQAAAAPQPAPENSESWFGLPDIFNGGRPAQTTPQQFGNDQLPPPPPAPGQPAPPPVLDSITAGLTDFATDSEGHFIVFLDNGQIWRQVESDLDPPHFSKTRKIQVTIERGALGSYELSVDDLDRTYKVKRVR
jgi:hypothetical protein